MQYVFPLVIGLIFSVSFLSALSDGAEIIIAGEDEVIILAPEEEGDSSGEEGTDPQRIIIKGRRESGPGEVPEQVSIITGEEIASSSSKDLGDIIESVPGVSLTRYGGNGSPTFISVRGSSAEQVLVLIDGKRINSAQGGGVDLSTIDPAAIRRIEVYRGGSSALYGDNALGGVINVVLEKTVPKVFSGSARAGLGSFGTYYGSLGFMGRVLSDSLEYSLNFNGLSSLGNYTYSDEHLPGEEERDNSDVLRGGGGAALIWKGDSLEIAGSVSLYLDQKGAPGTIEFPSSSARMKDRREQASLEAVWTGFGDFAFSGSWIHQIRSYSDPLFFLGPVDESHDNRALEGEIRWDGSVSDFSWTAGWSIRRDLLESTAFEGAAGAGYQGEIERIRQSLFLNSRIEFLRISLFPALRWDGWEDSAFQDIPPVNGSRGSWELGFLITLDSDERFMLKASGGSSYRIPSFNDLFWPATAFAVGNPDLLSEEAVHVDGGFVFRPLSFLTIEGAAFIRLVENLIQWTPGASGQWRPSNIGRARFIGIEGEINGIFDLERISSMAELGINGSWLHPGNITEGSASFGKMISRKPLWQVNSTAVITHDRGHSLGGELRWVGLRYITAQNTKVFDPYLTADFTASALIGDDFKILLSVKNLFNITYVDLREYPVPGIELGIEARYVF